MKQPEYNEIDSLLRSLAGRARSVSASAAGNSAGAHLDADELSSYAEGALPPATRARYTTHIVDCDDCRKVVAQLAVAAAPVIKESPVSVTPGIASWRKALAAFFTPPVMKYALPALILMFVGVVFFVRSGKNNSAIVVDNSAKQEQVAATSVPEAPGLAGKVSSTPAQGAKTDAQASRSQPAETKSGDAKQTESGATAAGAYGEFAKKPEEPRKEVAAVSAEDAEETKAVARPAVTADAPPPPKPATNTSPKDGPTASAGGQAVLRDKDKNERKRESENSTADGIATTQPRSSAGEDDRQKTKTLGAARAAARRDEADESRTVAGRRFNRYNGVWIDTKYQSSMSVVTVARGSEQYRALVADEPEIATIADQLKGEIFLVWKGRAYHLK